MKRGNTTDYTEDNGRSLEDDNLDEAYFKKSWLRSINRDRLETKYDALKAFSFSVKTGAPTCEAILRTLEMLAAVTGEDVFTSAALTMNGYGLRKGGVKIATENLLRRRGAEWLAMPQMHAWKQKTKSKREAACRTAAQYGIAGSSWAAVIDRLEKAYDEWADADSIEQVWPSGETGRHLKVRFARAWLGPENVPSTELMGVQFDKDGFGICPDNCDWRRLINTGIVALYGVVHDDGNLPREDSQEPR